MAKKINKEAFTPVWIEAGFNGVWFLCLDSFGLVVNGLRCITNWIGLV